MSTWDENSRRKETHEYVRERISRCSYPIDGSKHGYFFGLINFTMILQKSISKKASNFFRGGDIDLLTVYLTNSANQHHVIQARHHNTGYLLLISHSLSPEKCEMRNAKWWQNAFPISIQGMSEAMGNARIGTIKLDYRCSIFLDDTILYTTTIFDDMSKWVTLVSVPTAFYVLSINNGIDIEKSWNLIIGSPFSQWPKLIERSA